MGSILYNCKDVRSYRAYKNPIILCCVDINYSLFSGCIIDLELREASVNKKLDVRGTLRWDEDELDLEFDPDPEHDGHTRTVVLRMVHDS
jgi:hypothetical protein